ncbi:MAG: GTPase RsgA, partial [Clostridia bacterium]|nr:GTPase RsgA [Clostridia bacterium]
MEYRTKGKIIKGVGGLYLVRLDEGDGPLSGGFVPARARGVFRHNKITPIVGDTVNIIYTDDSYDVLNGENVPREDGRDIVISEITERKNSLIRPSVANIDIMFVTMAAASPEPKTETVDKLLSILEN